MVLAAAVELAQKTGAKLRLFRAVGWPPDIPTGILPASPDLVMKLLESNARNELAALQCAVPDHLCDGAYAIVGVPWDAICRAGIDYDADLIVVGSHGYGALDRLLGTTAAKVVNHADRSVLVVRARKDGPERQTSPDDK